LNRLVAVFKVVNVGKNELDNLAVLPDLRLA